VRIAKDSGSQVIGAAVTVIALMIGFIGTMPVQGGIIVAGQWAGVEVPGSDPLSRLVYCGALSSIHMLLTLYVLQKAIKAGRTTKEWSSFTIAVLFALLLYHYATYGLSTHAHYLSEEIPLQVHTAYIGMIIGWSGTLFAFRVMEFYKERRRHQ